MGGGCEGLGPKMVIPDYRIYRVEDVPRLVRVKEALASKGLTDPWLRNEVWRYNVNEWGTPRQNLKTFFLRGFKFSFAAFLATIALESAYDLLAGNKDRHHH